MATQKFVLDTRRRRNDGTYPVIQRIYIGVKYTARATGINLRKTEWDGGKQRINSSNPNHSNLNKWIEESRIEIQNIFLKTKFDPDISEIKQLLIGKNSTEGLFFEFAYRIIGDMHSSGRIGNAKAYRDAINKLRWHVASDDLLFGDISYKFLYDFEKRLLAQGLKMNSIASYMRSIRVMYNLGIKHGVATNAEYPFSTYRIKTTKTVNKVLIVAELQQLYGMLQREYVGDVYLSAFFLSFCLIGMSMVDLFFARWSDIQEGRLVYIRRKTGKIYSILLPELALEIIHNLHITDKSDGYLLPILNYALNTDSDRYRISRNHVGYCNRRLKKIGRAAGVNKPMSSYHSRYSWANTAKKAGVPKDVISEALGHEYGNRVTEIYLDKFHSKEIDQANQLVIETVFKRFRKKVK